MVSPLNKIRTPRLDQIRWLTRGFSSSKPVDSLIRRSYLYVPTSSDRMLEKSLTSNSDVIIYDLEDSIPPDGKDTARERLAKFLSDKPATELSTVQHVAVRLNSVDTPFFQKDIVQALSLPQVSTLVLPKIHSPQDLHHVSRQIYVYSKLESVSLRDPSLPPLELVATIESAMSMYNLGGIASWQSEYGPALGGRLVALLFGAEDYCADTSIIRTLSRKELLYSRSKLAIMAKAFKLQAIDMVCVNYRDLQYLVDECVDGRHLGFTGKQAIHPNQVDTIQSTFVPSSKEILRAAKIMHYMKNAHTFNKGAIGLPLEGGGEEMIDAPMIKQAQNIIAIAKSVGIEIPSVS